MYRKMVAHLSNTTSVQFRIYNINIPAVPLQAVFLFLHVKQAAPMRRLFGCGAP
jgi:hypothetical protein